MKDTIAFVSNVAYMNQLLKTLQQLKENGKWTGDILLFHAADIRPELLELLKEKEWITHTKQIENPVDVESIIAKAKADGIPKAKLFQYAKFHLFSTFMKQWDRVLYIDAGMTIHGDVNRFFAIPCQNTVYAHCDSYPTYTWNLHRQFLYKKTEELLNYDLTTTQYFQSGVLYYDTSIIEDTTFSRLVSLANTHYYSYGDQPILNLVFLCERNIWKQIPIRDDQGYLYDALRRSHQPYVIYKYEQIHLTPGIQSMHPPSF